MPTMPSRTQKTIQSIATFTLVVLIFTAFATFATGNSGTFNVLDFGAKGDGTNDDTASIQQAVDACAANGGGQVVLPGGKIFLTGAITLRSRVDFHLARGAVLKGSARWPGLRRGRCVAVCEGCEQRIHFRRRRA
jgi:hypothetical protein